MGKKRISVESIQVGEEQTRALVVAWEKIFDVYCAARDKRKDIEEIDFPDID